MQRNHKDIIKGNWDELITVTDNVEAIVQLLMSKNILNSIMAEAIMNKDDRKSKLCTLYELIQGRGDRAFSNMRDVLRETNNFKAEKIFNTYRMVNDNDPLLDMHKLDINSEYQQRAPQISIGYERSNIPTTIIVKRHPDNKFMDIDKEQLPNGTYRMRSKPRGYALIINIFKSPGYNDRTGSKLDTMKLKSLFENLGYLVETHSDLSLSIMKKIIKEFSQLCESSELDSTVVFIMAHGEQPATHERSVDLVCGDGFPLNTSWVIEQFANTSRTYPSERNQRKPKMFFFQACRGKKQNMGVRIRIDSAIENMEHRNAFEGRQYEDMFIVFSTLPGFDSKRDELDGAWFVNKFCEIVAENAWQYDLDSMLGQVDEEIRKMNSIMGRQAVEVVKQGLSRKIFFNPGL